jgi:phospho-N-acetylmuramoyl-pentapeptide-transferase
MLYLKLLELTDTHIIFNVFRYITFRIILAALTSMMVWFLLGRRFIAAVKRRDIRQYIRSDGPASHQSKAGTPTMGGLLVLGAALLSCLFWSDYNSQLVRLMWEVILLFGLIGMHDDYLKIRRRRNEGLTGRQKLVLQGLFGLFAGWACLNHPSLGPNLSIPGFKDLVIDLGPAYILFGALVLVSSSNAVNLTDGLDGLAIGPIIMSSGTYMILAYCAGNRVISGYLQIPAVPGSAEVAVVLASLIGSSLGFLWYNSFPADLFLGDTGSLSLGAALGLAAMMVKQELLLILVGGIFVIEALSVILQVGFFKATKGRRLLRCAPLHHHFEINGVPEPKVIVRFWIIAIILSLAGLSTLKLR